MTELLWACIIPTWNSADFIEKCLSSVINQSRPFDEVIVVDNGSKDQTCKIVHRFNLTKVLEFKTNLGFSAAINSGIRVSKADVVVWLNADAYIEKSFLKILDQIVRVNPHYSMFAPKIFIQTQTIPNKQECIENVGNYMWLDGLNWCVGRFELDNKQYDRNYEPMFPSGAVCAIRRKVFESIGYLDECFFAYGEDADFGLRAFLAGHRCLLIPKARATHLLSSSLGMNSEKKIYLVERNRILITWKNFPIGLLMLSIPFAAIRYYLWFFAIKDKSRVRPLIKKLGRKKLLAIILVAHVDAIKMIVKGKVYRRLRLRSSLNYLARVHPFLIKLRDLIST